MNLEKLKEPIIYQWKQNDKLGNCVAYIDARQVQDKFDEVCGQENWQDIYQEIHNHLFCGIGVKIGDEWIWKWDVGVPPDVEATKGEASDAFKRAAVHWGVGRFLYDLDIIRLKTKPYGDKKRLMVCDDAGNILWGSKAVTAFCMSKSSGSGKGNESPKKTTKKGEKKPPNNDNIPFPNEDEKKVLNEIAVILAGEDFLGIPIDSGKVGDVLFASAKRYPQDLTVATVTAKWIVKHCKPEQVQGKPWDE